MLHVVECVGLTFLPEFPSEALRRQDHRLKGFLVRLDVAPLECHRLDPSPGCSDIGQREVFALRCPAAAERMECAML